MCTCTDTHVYMHGHTCAHTVSSHRGPVCPQNGTQQQFCDGMVIYSVRNLAFQVVQPSIPGPWTIILPPSISWAQVNNFNQNTSAGESWVMW